jgi:hypothetical protein
MQSLIDAGLGDKLIAGSYSRWLIVGPRVLGKEVNPLYPHGQCVFLNNNDRCELHDLGLKPLECRTSNCGRSNRGLGKYVRDKWNNPQAQSLVDIWIAADLIKVWSSPH